MVAITQFEVDSKWTSVANGDVFMQQIANETNAVLSVIGQSVLGKNIYALTIGVGANKCLITSGVHGTEPASREAILMKTRDVCYNSDGKYDDYLTNNTVMFVPTINPDRMFISYRNESDIDINRVIYHLDSPEGNAYLETMLKTFKADVHFDFHEHSGHTDKDLLYVFPMNLDPNSDIAVKQGNANAIAYVRNKAELGGFSTDFYFPWSTGFGSLTSGSGILGKIAVTSESSTAALPNIRINAQKLSFDSFLEWHNSNHSFIDNMNSSFVENMLDGGDVYKLLLGMTKGSEMYGPAIRKEITLPQGYQLDNVNEFADFIDMYGIHVDKDNIIRVNQPTGRMIPHLLDPESEVSVASATRVETLEPERRTDGRYTKVLYDDWREVFIKYL